MGDKTEGGYAPEKWRELAERTLRGALGVGSVTVLVEDDVSSCGSGGGRAATVGSAGTDLLTRPRRGHLVRMSRPGRPFSTDERDIADRLISALGDLLPDSVMGTGELPSQRLVAAALQEVLARLDDHHLSPAATRLTIAIDGLAECLGASGWWVGSLTEDRPIGRVESNVVRHGAAGDALRARLALPYAEWEHKDTDAMLEGGSLVTAVTDGPEIAAELQSWGDVRTLVAAGGYDLDARRWMVTMLGDADSFDVRQAQASVNAAVQAALGFPRAPRFA